jgi:hypothetical protein
MRYESFYPFARQQSTPNLTRQLGFGPPPYAGNPHMQRPGNPFGGFPQSGQRGPRGPHGFGGPAAPGGNRMDSYLQTANRFLNTAQQFAPIVQQFAPMVQNLPAMWKLYKGFQSLPSTQNAGTNTAGQVANARQSAANTSTQPTAPRIFQPPN